MKKGKDDLINRNCLNQRERKILEIKEAKAAVEDNKFNNKKVRYIKKGVTGKNL